jgi:glycosyltransferase involved in cell wall biosynthesis
LGVRQLSREDLMASRWDHAGAANPFSVVIPVYNEEVILVDNVRRLVAYLDQLHTPYEIIIGSNGSSDRTPELGRGLQKEYPDVKFFHLQEKGPGAAFGKAVSLALYDHIISVDMDLSVDLNFIRRANELLDEYSVVVGSKRMGTQDRSAVRKLASNLFIFSAIMLLGLSYDDYSLAAKAYRKKVLLDCADRIGSGTFYVVEILNYALKNEYMTAQIPARCHDDRKSRFNLLHEGVYRFGNLFKLWLFPRSRFHH